ncbi:NAD(P)-dependent oxidoreductase [Pleomorphomonas koreensis]|uniref:NAD(P)-dependent oxidoreductase n=1 Tax=Pleomorphomonas koreensis TaxID=257440 RepID=UPI000411946B|nr:NAD(P)-dependent oxidoreductase [Pleomorphomonas koreensis]
MVQDQESRHRPASVTEANTPEGTVKILIVDPIGLRFGTDGMQDHSEVEAFITERGGVFHGQSAPIGELIDDGRVHFHYQPGLSTPDEIRKRTEDGQYDAVIAAATFIPAEAKFRLGGARIGTGTGNMGSLSWGGPNGEGGVAPLMNTPGINSRATAQMAFKALMRVTPDLPVGELHRRVVGGDFDTGKNLSEYPTEKLENKTIAILGYGNIGRELARIATAFHMNVVFYARPSHRDMILAEGYAYAETPAKAATGAHVLSVHLGLGRQDPDTKIFSNQHLINGEVLSALTNGAVVLNYDRGELIDVRALDEALARGKVRHAAIDADIFKSADGISGPMKPYLSLVPKHADKLELLPHAAADTDHPTRVAGAKQAVDQLLDSVRNRRVTNLVGDLPDGYRSNGKQTPPGIGPSTRADLLRLLGTGRVVDELRELSETLGHIFRELTKSSEEAETIAMVDRYLLPLSKALLKQDAILRATEMVAIAKADD